MRKPERRRVPFESAVCRLPVPARCQAPRLLWATWSIRPFRPSLRSLRQRALRGVEGSRGNRYASSTHEIRSELIPDKMAEPQSNTVAVFHRSPKLLCQSKRCVRSVLELLGRQRSDGTWSNSVSSSKEDDPLVATSLAAGALGLCRAAISR